MGSSNIEGLSLTIGGGVQVTGKVRVEGETTESLAKVQVMLQPAGGPVMFGPLPNQPVKPDGSFQMDDVGPDRYNLTVSGLPEGFYVARVRSANVDVLAEGLDVSGGSPAPLEVVLSPKAAQVSGTVMDPKTQKAAVATSWFWCRRRRSGAIASHSTGPPTRMPPDSSPSRAWCRASIAPTPGKRRNMARGWTGLHEAAGVRGETVSCSKARGRPSSCAI